MIRSLSLAVLTRSRLFVVAWSSHPPACAAMGFELRFQLFKLGLLLVGQYGLHLLTKLKSFAHEFGLQARHFRQFLSGLRFIERTAFKRLAQPLPLGLKLRKQRFVAFRKAFADLFQLRFLIVS